MSRQFILKSHSGSLSNCGDVGLFGYWLTGKFEKQRGHCGRSLLKDANKQRESVSLRGGRNLKS